MSKQKPYYFNSGNEMLRDEDTKKRLRLYRDVIIGVLILNGLLMLGIAAVLAGMMQPV